MYTNVHLKAQIVKVSLDLHFTITSGMYDWLIYFYIYWLSFSRLLLQGIMIWHLMLKIIPKCTRDLDILRNLTVKKSVISSLRHQEWLILKIQDVLLMELKYGDHHGEILGTVYVSSWIRKSLTWEIVILSKCLPFNAHLSFIQLATTFGMCDKHHLDTNSFLNIQK